MERDIHVVVVPFVAFGHLMPFYELTVALAKTGVRVSYVSTPKNIQRLPKLPPSLAPLVNFVKLPLPALGSNLLPEGAEATVDILEEKTEYLMAAFDLLEQPLKKFVSEHSPDWIITDFVAYWTVNVAQECNVPLAIFSAFSAASNVFFGPPEYLTGDGQKRVRSTPEGLTSPPWWVSFPSTVAFRRNEAMGALFGFYTPNASGITGSERVARTLNACKVVGVRSCREFEAEYFDLFEKMMGKPVVPVGVLAPESPSKRQIADESWIETFKWLDEQLPKSVVFVGFGSELKLSRNEVNEIAYGLESSELPFLWSLRKPDWAVDDLDALPPGFSHRTSHRGKVCIGWAPQKDILAHPSIGASLFHTGWGSVIENLQHGHCIVALPFIVDQPLNARLLVEKGLAIEVERSEDGGFCKDDIAKCLIRAMVSKEGEEMRARAEKVAGIFADRKLQEVNVAGFVEYLKKEAA